LECCTPGSGTSARRSRISSAVCAIAVSRNDAIVESIIRLNLAEARIGLGQLDLAEELCALSLEQAQRRGDHLTAAGALKCQASIERERGALDKSIATLRIAIYEAEGAEDQLLHAEMLRELGEISRSLGNAGAARSAWREAAESFKSAGARHDLAEAPVTHERLAGLGSFTGLVTASREPPAG